jgi:hypothetical protein
VSRRTAIALDHWSTRDWERHLGDGRADAVFRIAELEGLPEPVQRYVRAAIALGTPMATTARLDMRGHIKAGPLAAVPSPPGPQPACRVHLVRPGRWSHLRLRPLPRWRRRDALEAARPLRRGPRHRTGRLNDCGWPRPGRKRSGSPGLCSPRYGVAWTSDDDHHNTARHRLGTTPIVIRLTIDDSAAVRAVSFQRWGDPDTSGTWRWHTFGRVITGHRTIAGLTIPSRGRLGMAHRSRRTGERRALSLRDHIVGPIVRHYGTPMKGRGTEGRRR